MKPILFNTEMVRAILDGRKMVTRRVLKLPKHIVCEADGTYTLFAEGDAYHNQYLGDIGDYITNKPYKIGDVMWVRETWAETTDLFGEFPEYLYRADFLKAQLKWENDGEYEIATDFPDCAKWHPSIHMPNEAARIFLKVTDIRVERLREITEEQAILEGANCITTPNIPGVGKTYTQGFGELWNTTIKKQDIDTYGWDANPWVWVIEFERISKEDAE